jgi:recombination protein RecT
MPQATALVPYKAYKNDLPRHKEVFLHLLPPRMDVERFVAQALIMLHGTPKLLMCTRESIMEGFYRAAKDGLELGIDCTLVAFKQRDETYAATYMRYYRGLVRLIEQNGIGLKAFGEVVYSGDTFSLDYGEATKPLIHIPARGSRGDPEGAYGAIITPKYVWHVHYMDRLDLEMVKIQVIGKNPERYKGPWVSRELEMWRKTALTNVCKYVPLTATQQTALAEPEGELAGTIGPARARQHIAEMFDRHDGAPEPQLATVASDQGGPALEVPEDEPDLMALEEQEEGF